MCRSVNASSARSEIQISVCRLSFIRSPLLHPLCLLCSVNMFSPSNRIRGRCVFRCFQLIKSQCPSLCWFHLGSSHPLFSLFICILTFSKLNLKTRCHNVCTITSKRERFTLKAIDIKALTAYSFQEAAVQKKKTMNKKRKLVKGRFFFFSPLPFCYFITHYHRCGSQFVCTKADYCDPTRSIPFILPGSLARMYKSSISQNGSFAFILFNTRRCGRQPLSVYPLASSIEVVTRMHKERNLSSECRMFLPCVICSASCVPFNQYIRYAYTPVCSREPI